jgi:membrane protein YdbS with pleckstrin-like domain
MAKKITTKGALQAAIDIVLLALCVAGIMYASVLQDVTMWFFYGAGVFFLFTCLELISKVTKPIENYDTQDVV